MVEYDFQKGGKKVLYVMGKKKGRGRACQTQRSVVDGEEQEELMWTKKTTDEKKMATRVKKGTGGEKINAL
jgi:hypothetical protein